MNPLPTPLTDAAQCVPIGVGRSQRYDYVPVAFAQQLERDAMTLARHMYAHDAYLFTPEVSEVMNRWRPRVRALLSGKP